MNNIKIISKYVIAIEVTLMTLFGTSLYAQTGNSNSTNEVAQNPTQQQLQQIQTAASNESKQAREEVRKIISHIGNNEKRNAATRIASHLDEMNQVTFNHFTSLLNKFTIISKQIKSRRDKAAANGKNVSSVNASIIRADRKILEAKQIITQQAQKAYIIDYRSISPVASVSTKNQNVLLNQLRVEFEKTRQQISEDFISLRNGPVNDASVYLRISLDELSLIPDVDKEPTKK